jgi:diguanylate cyclase (GGDEF)-like protein
MKLDVHTLLFVAIHVEAILGLLLVFAWVQNTTINAVAWWGSAHLMRAGSFLLYGMHGSILDVFAIDLSNAILITSFAVMWTGARVFEGRPPRPVAFAAGAAVWLAASSPSLAAFFGNISPVLCVVIMTAYIWLTVYEFWHGRDESLVSRLPTILILAAYGALFVLKTPFTALQIFPVSDTVFAAAWLMVPGSESLLFTIAIAFMMLAIAKERTGHRHMTDAMIDSLTGVSNRRGFLLESDALVKRLASHPQPTAMLQMDLDHFKSINDRFGHAVGDRVLQVFSEIIVANVRPSDLVGRLGGEEFALFLCNVSRTRALVVAERIRSAFAEVAVKVGEHPVSATVSVGVAVCEDATINISALLAQADLALYRAKGCGRNRVEIAGAERPMRRAVDLILPPQPVAKAAA